MSLTSEDPLKSQFLDNTIVSWPRNPLHLSLYVFVSHMIKPDYTCAALKHARVCVCVYENRQIWAPSFIHVFVSQIISPYEFYISVLSFRFIFSFFYLDVKLNVQNTLLKKHWSCRFYLQFDMSLGATDTADEVKATSQTTAAGNCATATEANFLMCFSSDVFLF